MTRRSCTACGDLPAVSQLTVRRAPVTRSSHAIPGPASHYDPGRRPGVKAINRKPRRTPRHKETFVTCCYIASISLSMRRASSGRSVRKGSRQAPGVDWTRLSDSLKVVQQLREVPPSLFADHQLGSSLTGLRTIWDSLRPALTSC
jgi:hypothetical protein